MRPFLQFRTSFTPSLLEKSKYKTRLTEVVYQPYRIPNARRTGPNQFDNPVSKEDFLKSIEFGDRIYNTEQIQES